MEVGCLLSADDPTVRFEMSPAPAGAGEGVRALFSFPSMKSRLGANERIDVGVPTRLPSGTRAVNCDSAGSSEDVDESLFVRCSDTGVPGRSCGGTALASREDERTWPAITACCGRASGISAA